MEDRCSKQVNILQGRGCDGRSREAPAFLEEEQEGSGRAKEEEGKERPFVTQPEEQASPRVGWEAAHHCAVSWEGEGCRGSYEVKRSARA